MGKDDIRKARDALGASSETGRLIKNAREDLLGPLQKGSVENAARQMTAMRDQMRGPAFQISDSLKQLRNSANKPLHGSVAPFLDTARWTNRHRGAGSLSEVAMAREAFLAESDLRAAEIDAKEHELKLLEAIAAKEAAEAKYEELKKANEARSPSADVPEDETEAKALVRQAREHEHQARLEATRQAGALEVARVNALWTKDTSLAVEAARGRNANKTAIISGVALILGALLGICGTLLAQKANAPSPAPSAAPR